jgi:hypothetical protein
MKTIFVLAAALFLCTSAMAAPVTGRASLTFSIDGAFDSVPVGTYVIEIWEEGGIIHGNPGLTQLYKTENGYKGWLMGGYVDFSCSRTDSSSLGCSSQLASRQANLVFSRGRITGSIAMRSVSAERTATKIVVNADGMLNLQKSGDGVYRGYGALSGDPFSYASEVVLETSGTMKDLADPALFATFLISPLVDKQ